MGETSRNLKDYKDSNSLTNEQVARKLSNFSGIDVPLVSVTRWIKGKEMSKVYQSIVDNFLKKNS